MTITRNLVELIRSKNCSEEDLDQAALLFLDALATAYAGSVTPVGRKLLDWARRQPLNTRTTAFLIGALTHITETDDLHRASATHPGCIVVPCALALAQQRQIADKNILLAMLRGFEAMCRIGNAVGPAHYRIWHNTATCGPFGSAFAAAELLELDQQQTVNALGNAGTQSSGLWQFLQSGAMSKHLHAGRGSEAGLLAAELAQQDFTGPADILEGEKGFFVGLCPDPQPELVLEQADGPWQLRLTSIKPWPSCRHTHPSIDAALEIHSKLGNKVIDSVKIETYEAAINVCDRAVSNSEYQAKFSLQHCTAKALLDGRVTLDSFNERAREEAADLSLRIQVASVDPYKSNYPVAWGGSVTVATTDGETMVSSRQDCKGDPELALNKEEMLEKAQMLMSYAGLTATQAQAICDQVLAMPQSTQASQLAEQFLDRVLA